MEPILDPEERELEEGLMRAGRDVGMSPKLRDKTLAALAAGSVGVTAASGAKAASTFGWMTSKVGAIWSVGAVVGVGGAVALGIGLGKDTESHASLASARQMASTKVDEVNDSKPIANGGVEPKAGEVPSEDPPQSERAVEAEEDSASPPGRAAAAAPKDPLAADAPATDKTSSLREELSHVAKVESSLSAGDPQKALQLLARYRSRFSRPQLGLEVEILTIQALHESGSVTAASGRAARFLENHPNSPLSARAKRYVE